MIELTCGSCQTEFSIKLPETLSSIDNLRISCPCCHEHLPQKMNDLLIHTIKADIDNNGWRLCFDTITKNKLID